MGFGSKSLNLIVILIFASAIAALGVWNFLLNSDIAYLKQKAESIPTALPAAAEPSPVADGCGEDCKAYIDEKISETLATASAAPKTVYVGTPAKSTKSTAYLDLNGSTSTTQTGWTDVTSTDIWIDVANDYGKDAYVDWEAFLHTQSSGSKAMARLYDVTHSIAVASSDLETNAIASTRVSSGRLYLWAGHNLYRVQIKSLNGLPATFDGGRIKIVY